MLKYRLMLSFACLLTLALSTASYAMDGQDQPTGGATVSHPAPKSDAERIEAEARKAEKKAKKAGKKAKKKWKKHGPKF